MLKPNDFRSDNPPERIMGTEMETAPPAALTPLEIIAHIIEQTGSEPLVGTEATRFLRNGAKAYRELDALVEYASAESLGPRDAVISYLAGQELLRQAVIELLQKKGEDPSLFKNGVFSRVGFYILNHMSNMQMDSRSDYQATGYHESYFAPKWRDDTYATAGFFGSFQTTKFAWAGSGMFYNGQYLTSQKGLSVGYNEVTSKPHNSRLRGMFRLDSNATPIGFQRVEVRSVDVNRSPYIQWLGMAATSLALRYIEYEPGDLRDLVLNRIAPSVHQTTLHGNDALLTMVDGRTIRPLEFQHEALQKIDKRLTFVNIPDEERVALNALLRITSEKAVAEQMGWHPRLSMLSKKLGEDVSEWKPEHAIIYDMSFDNLLRNFNSTNQVVQDSIGIPRGITADQVTDRTRVTPNTRAHLRATREETSYSWTSGKEYMDPYQTAA